MPVKKIKIYFDMGTKFFSLFIHLQETHSDNCAHLVTQPL